MIEIIDDEEVIRDALTWLCKSRGLEVRAHASAGDFLTAIDDGIDLLSQPSCLLLDVRMPGISGVELFDQLLARKLVPPATVLFLTGHGDVPMAVEMLKKGAYDFVEKPFSDNQLIDRLIQGEALSRSHIAAGAISSSVAARRTSLSQREREVMDLILAGKLNKVIADELGITMRTVEVHRARVFAKMGVRSAIELAQLNVGHST